MGYFCFSKNFKKKLIFFYDFKEELEEENREKERKRRNILIFKIHIRMHVFKTKTCSFLFAL